MISAIPHQIENRAKTQGLPAKAGITPCAPGAAFCLLNQPISDFFTKPTLERNDKACYRNQIVSLNCKPQNPYQACRLGPILSLSSPFYHRKSQAIAGPLPLIFSLKPSVTNVTLGLTRTRRNRNYAKPACNPQINTSFPTNGTKCLPDQGGNAPQPSDQIPQKGASPFKRSQPYPGLLGRSAYSHQEAQTCV